MRLTRLPVERAFCVTPPVHSQRKAAIPKHISCLLAPIDVLSWAYVTELPGGLIPYGVVHRAHKLCKDISVHLKTSYWRVPASTRLDLP